MSQILEFVDSVNRLAAGRSISYFPSPEHRKELIEAFNNYPSSEEDVSARYLKGHLCENLADMVGHRIYLEWCVLNAQMDNQKITRYQGEPYQEFLNEEVWFHLCREAKSKGRPSAECAGHKEYLEQRRVVVGGLARRAARLYVESGLNVLGFKERLRDSLKEEIKQSENINLAAKLILKENW